MTVYTYLGNVKIKTTKYTTLTLEWRHVKAKNFDVVGAGDDDMSGDQVYAIYKYCILKPSTKKEKSASYGASPFLFLNIIH